MPPLEGLPNSFVAELGTAEHAELTARVEAGELSRAVVKDDEITGRVPNREVFCPIDFDIAYVSVATSKDLGILALEWVQPYYRLDGCRFAPLEVYVDEYNRQHQVSNTEGKQ